MEGGQLNTLNPCPNVLVPFQVTGKKRNWCQAQDSKRYLDPLSIYTSYEILRDRTDKESNPVKYKGPDVTQGDQVDYKWEAPSTQNPGSCDKTEEPLPSSQSKDFSGALAIELGVLIAEPVGKKQRPRLYFIT